MCSALIWATGTLNHIRVLSRPEQFYDSKLSAAITQTLVMTCVCVPQISAASFSLLCLVSFCISYLLLALLVTEEVKQLLYWFWFMRRTVSYLQGFYVICEGKDILRIQKIR